MSSDAEAQLIELLNDQHSTTSFEQRNSSYIRTLSGRSNEESEDESDKFLDENGLPTDQFLEAVKAELTGFDNRRRNEIQQDDAKRFQTWKQQASDMSSRKAQERKTDNVYFNKGTLTYRPK